MNSLFVLKCIVQEHPITMIFSLWVMTVLIFSYVIRILEQENPDFDYKNYYNSIWYCLVTLTSIGYGDFYPKSPLGKICKINRSCHFHRHVGRFLHFPDDGDCVLIHRNQPTRTQSDQPLPKGPSRWLTPAQSGENLHEDSHKTALDSVQTAQNYPLQRDQVGFTRKHRFSGKILMQRLYNYYKFFLNVKKSHNKYEKYDLKESGSDNFEMIRDKLQTLDDRFIISLIFLEEIENIVNEI